MTHRIKKPAVRPELRREWLRRHEENGESPPEIARADGYDVRTVRKQIEIERQERERREARSVVLREALQRHYANLCSFAQKLDSHVTAETSSLQMLRADPMWSSMREHVPQSTLWKNLDKWESLREQIRHADGEVRRRLEVLIVTRAPLNFPVSFPRSSEETGLGPGIIDALASHFVFTAQGEVGLEERASFALVAVDQGKTLIEYGPYTIGKVPNNRVAEIKNLVLGLSSEITTWEEHDEMSRLFAALHRIQREVHDELLTVILRRIIPGRCRYCPV
jgi:hypothetical protein